MKPSKTILSLCLLMFSLTATAQTGGDKLDVKALEQKYWAAKDDDFSVVQNRAFSKAKRFYGTVNYGRAINDPYYTGSYLGLAGGYFFNESWGLDVSYQSASLGRSNSFNEILKKGGSPTVNQAKSKLGVNASWMPIYAKMSLFDKKIIHFDMGFSLGVAQMSYGKQHYDGTFTTFNSSQLNSTNDSSLGYSFGITQQFYFNRLAAIKVDFVNTFSNQKTVIFGNTAGGKPTNGSSKSINDTSLMIGLSVFSWWGEKK